MGLVALGAVLAPVLLAFAAAYVAWPTLVSWALPRALAPYGIEDVTFDADRPRPDGMSVARLTLKRGVVSATLEAVDLRWTFAGLRAGRLVSVSIDRAHIAVAASDEPTILEIPPLWDLLPADRAEVLDLALSIADPNAAFAGRFAFDAERARVAFTVTSDLLAAPLALDAGLDRSGRLDVALAEPGGETPLIDLHGLPAAGRLAVEGTATIAGAPLALIAALVGVDAAEGRLDAQFRGSVTWPLPEVWRRADGNGSGTVAIRLAGRIKGGIPFAVAGTLEAALEDSAVALRLLPDAALTIDRIDVAGWQAERVRLSVSEPVRVSVPAAADRVGLQAPGVAVTLPTLRAGDRRMVFDDAAALTLALEGELPWPLPADPLGVATAELRAEATLDATFAGFPVEWLNCNASATARLTSGRVEATVAPGFEATLGGIADPTEGVRLPEAALTLAAPLTARFDVATSALTVRARDIGWSVPELHAAGQRLAFRRGRLDLESFTRRDAAIAATARVWTRTAKDALPVALDVRVPAAGRGGRVRVSTEGTIKGGLLKRELGGWKSDYDIDAGALAASFEGAWTRADDDVGIAGSGRIALADGAAHYEDTTVAGLAFDLPFAWQAGAATAGPARVLASAIDVGLPVQDVAATVALTADAVTIDAAGASLLGGRVAVERLVYPFGGGRSDFDVALDGLALTEVLALEGEDIAGDGVLDGRLPVRLDGGAFTVTDGHVLARPPGGKIRYTGSVGAAARKTPGLGLALEALSDFTYTRLEADADYLADGTLNLLVRLEGRNPAVEKGRPIHFNLNVTENIPTLLRALRVGDEVSERVQGRFTK